MTEIGLRNALEALTPGDISDLSGLASQYHAVYKMHALYHAARDLVDGIGPEHPAPLNRECGYCSAPVYCEPCLEGDWEQSQEDAAEL